MTTDTIDGIGEANGGVAGVTVSGGTCAGAIVLLGGIYEQ